MGQYKKLEKAGHLMPCMFKFIFRLLSNMGYTHFYVPIVIVSLSDYFISMKYFKLIVVIAVS